MKKLLLFFFLVSFSFLTKSQNEIVPGILKFYYYKTNDDFFNHKKDSLTGTNMEYNYGKLSYTDVKTGKQVKFNLHKDSSYFAFQIAQCKNGAKFPVFAVGKGQKRYGVFLGGDQNLFCIMYSRGNINDVVYNKQNYAESFFGTIDEFGYSLVFTKKDFESKSNGDIEYFIKDNEVLFKKYVAEREDSSTYNWNKNFVMIQLKYLFAYNNMP